VLGRLCLARVVDARGQATVTSHDVTFTNSLPSSGFGLVKVVDGDRERLVVPTGKVEQDRGPTALLDGDRGRFLRRIRQPRAASGLAHSGGIPSYDGKPPPRRHVSA
jgi:hypothetical protein